MHNEESRQLIYCTAVYNRKINPEAESSEETLYAFNVQTQGYGFLYEAALFSARKRFDGFGDEWSACGFPSEQQLDHLLRGVTDRVVVVVLFSYHMLRAIRSKKRSRGFQNPFRFRRMMGL